jgi:hypothetical protein
MTLQSRPAASPWSGFLTEFDWDYFATLTHRLDASAEQFDRAFRHKFVRRLSRTSQGPVGWFFVVEESPKTKAHIHALIQTATPTTVDQVGHAWTDGFAQVRNYNSSFGIELTAYVTKALQRGEVTYDISGAPLRRLTDRLTPSTSYGAGLREPVTGITSTFLERAEYMRGVMGHE